jgi:nucleoside-diphosphate-sugar epimerase
MKVLVTGVSGFIGSALFQHLNLMDGLKVVGSSRVGNSDGIFKVDDLSSETNWTHALAGVNVVIHTAGRAHEASERNGDALIDFRRINVDGTLALARQASMAGVRRFIYISTVKVNGESTELGAPFKESDFSQPVGSYAISKFEAEQGLQSISVETGMDVVIIRPTLVYGAGVKANFLTLLLAIKTKKILPIGGLVNRRSFVALGNLLDFIVVCMQHSEAANQIFLVSDGCDLSVAELAESMATLLQVPLRSISVPYRLLWTIAILLGKKHALQRISSNLQVDISKANSLLSWRPTISPLDELRNMVNGLDKLN